MEQYVQVLYNHINVRALGTEQRIWIMQCRDHPLPNKKDDVIVNLKNGVHIHFPDLACDRRKLIEIRMDSLDMCRYFTGTCNNFEDMFDLAVYKVFRFFYLLEITVDKRQSS